MNTVKLTWGLLWRIVVTYLLFLRGTNEIFAIAQENPNIYTSGFIILKPTLASGGLALLFAAIRLFANRSLIEYIFGYRLPFSVDFWKKFDQGMLVFLVTISIVNLIVGITTPTAIWVNYRFYGQLTFTVLGVAILAFWIASMDHKSQNI